MSAWKDLANEAYHQDRATEKASRAWKKRALAAEAQVQAVRELHRNHDDCPDGFEDCAGYGKCRKCGEDYPCSTIRTLDGDDADLNLSPGSFGTIAWDSLDGDA